MQRFIDDVTDREQKNMLSVFHQMKRRSIRYCNPGVKTFADTAAGLVTEMGSQVEFFIRAFFVKVWSPTY